MASSTMRRWSSSRRLLRISRSATWMARSLTSWRRSCRARRTSCAISAFAESTSRSASSRALSSNRRCSSPASLSAAARIACASAWAAWIFAACSSRSFCASARAACASSSDFLMAWVRSSIFAMSGLYSSLVSRNSSNRKLTAWMIRPLSKLSSPLECSSAASASDGSAPSRSAHRARTTLMMNSPAEVNCEIRDKRYLSITLTRKLSSVFPVLWRDDPTPNDEVSAVENHGLPGCRGALGLLEPHLDSRPVGAYRRQGRDVAVPDPCRHFQRVLEPRDGDEVHLLGPEPVGLDVPRLADHEG